MMWTILPARMRSSPAIGQILLTIEAGKIVQPTGASQTVAGGLWLEATYRAYRGWIYAGLLEQLVPNPGLPDVDIVSIADDWQNPDVNAARQYILIDGQVKHNLCGPFCAAYVSNSSIKQFLGMWKAAAPEYWRISVQQDKPVGLGVVDTMLAVWGRPAVRFTELLRDPVAGIVISPARLKDLLQHTWRLIAGVKIGSNGKLNAGNIGHWVVLEDVQPYGIGDGAVTIYNPFANRYETYSYPEFMRSMTSWGSHTGTWYR